MERLKEIKREYESPSTKKTLVELEDSIGAASVQVTNVQNAGISEQKVYGAELDFTSNTNYFDWRNGSASSSTGE